MADRNYINIFNRINRVVQQIPSRVAVLAVNFSKDRFVQKNWIDSQPEPWTKTKKRKGSTLVASGRLKRSIRKVRISPSQVVIGTDAPYARAHNDGEEIQGTEQVKSHTRREHRRKSHRRKGKRIKAYTVKAYTVKAHSRKYHRKFAKRQFIGKSKRLTNNVKMLIKNELDIAIRG